MITLSLVIPTYQRADSVKRLLLSIDEQVISFEEIEVILVSNFADEGMDTVLKSTTFKNISPHYYVVNKKGVNASRNLGIDKSQGQYILFLDDDCRLHESNYLRRLILLHKSYPDAGVIGGGYDIPHEATEEEIAYNLIAREWQTIYRLGNNESTRLVGGNLSYKKSMLDSTQERFNEEIVYGGSESEFNQRLKNKGVQLLFFSNLNVLHESKLNTSDLINKSQKQALSHTLYDIDGGGSRDQLKSYQTNSHIWALKAAKNQKQYQRILLLMELYDWVYQYVSRFPRTSPWKLRWKANHWLRQHQNQWNKETF